MLDLSFSFHRAAEEDAVLVGYEAASLANRSSETSITVYRTMESRIPEQHLRYIQTPRSDLAEDLIFVVVVILVLFTFPLKFNVDAEISSESSGSVFSHVLPEDAVTHN